MKAIFTVLALTFAMLGAAQAGTACNDGSYSQSSGSGTCSHHGGEK